MPINIFMIYKTSGKILCELTRQKLNFLEGVYYIWSKHKNFKPTIKHGGGSMTVWGC